MFIKTNDGFMFVSTFLTEMTKSASIGMFLDRINYLVVNFFFLNKCISDFIPFSPNLVANHTPISSITPPPPPHAT